MSLQVVPRVPVRMVPSSVEWTTPPGCPEPEPVRPSEVLTLTSRDVMDEARRRLASKDIHWD